MHGSGNIEATTLAASDRVRPTCHGTPTHDPWEPGRWATVSDEFPGKSSTWSSQGSGRRAAWRWQSKFWHHPPQKRMATCCRHDGGTRWVTVVRKGDRGHRLLW